MKKLYIVDALNYLFRSYYAIGPMTNNLGESTSALYGFIRSIYKLCKEMSAENIVVVFDGPENKVARQALYGAYKAHRKKAPEDLYPQISLAYEFCEYAGLPKLCIPNVEADDTIASVALWAEKMDYEVYICTSDKDLFQLVSDKIFILQVNKNNAVLDPKKVEEIFGILPKQIRDYLAITGDSSDNIPGIPSFGPKTASQLLQKFNNLDYILENPKEVIKGKKQQILIEYKEQALLSKDLATLDTTVDFPKDPSFFILKEPDNLALIAMYKRMNFLQLLKKVGEKSPEKPSLKLPSYPEVSYNLINDKESLQDLCLALSNHTHICVDTETTSINPMSAELVGIGLGVHPAQSWYIPCNGNLSLSFIVKTLLPLFTDPNISFLGHNIKYDLHVLNKIGLKIENIHFDTMLASYLIHPDNRRHSLAQLALEILDKHATSITTLIGEGKKQISMNDVDIAKVQKYCCEDVDYTLRLSEYFKNKITACQLGPILYEIELPLLPILAKMETNGIYVDVQKLKNIAEDLCQKITHITQEIYTKTGKEFNLNSPKQLSEILYEHLQLKPPSRKKTAFSTGAKILEFLQDAHPVVKDIISYRALEKLRSTYVEALPQQVNQHTGRIHCTFSQATAATGRLSSQDPNLQNIPIRTEEGRKIRTAFMPQKKGWSYISADYSQIELRLLAHYSKDPELIKAFIKGEDIHTYSASLLFDTPLEKVSKAMRHQAKAVNFGILYGQGPFGLSQELNISRQDAAHFIETYFARYPQVLAYIEKCKEFVKENKYAITLTGRKRPIFEISNKNANIRAFGERLAVNTPLQGTAADLIKIAMIQINKKIQHIGLQGFMILQIHDELLFEVPDSEIEPFFSMIKQEMESVFTLDVPLEVNVKIGKNWAEC